MDTKDTEDTEEIYKQYMPYDYPTMVKINTPAFLTQDSNGFEWNTNDETLNGYIGHLPWWAFDREIKQDCLLYQVDSNGKLYFLQIIHVIKIKTGSKRDCILYKIDSRHAKLQLYSIPHGFRFKIGLKSMSRR